HRPDAARFHPRGGNLRHLSRASARGWVPLRLRRRLLLRSGALPRRQRRRDDLGGVRREPRPDGPPAVRAVPFATFTLRVAWPRPASGRWPRRDVRDPRVSLPAAELRESLRGRWRGPAWRAPLRTRRPELRRQVRRGGSG